MGCPPLTQLITYQLIAFIEVFMAYLDFSKFNPFMPSPHNNIKPPHFWLSEFYIADLTFGMSCRRE